MSDFGTNLKKLMREQKVTAAELSRVVGVPSKSVQEWTQKGRFPRSQEIIQRLSEYFNCSVHKLLYGTEDPRSGALETILEKAEILNGLYEISIKKVGKK